MQSKAVLNAAIADQAIHTFTQADGALSTWPLGQTAVTANSPATASNQASLPNTAKFGLNHNSADVMLRAKFVSKNGEALYWRADANGYYYATNNAAGNTIIGYFTISGSVNTVLATIAGAAANDIITILHQGAGLDVVRNNNVIFQIGSNLALSTAKEHGIRNFGGAGTVLMDDLYIVPIS